MLVMKVVYVTLDALKSDGVRKIAYSIKKCSSVEFNVMFPKISLVRRGGIMSRLFAGIIIWLLFCRLCLLMGVFFWVTNCSDILFLRTSITGWIYRFLSGK